ncbi:hypothetical protein [Paraburkholderia sp. D1E]|uniref:hypothetical protein n=1 Tax=Paraburkholderia sp. D1E TaxID=3461398 RepID=UPI0040460B9E
MFGDEPMPAGPQNGMHPGYPHSMPGVLGGLPSWGTRPYGQFHPAPPAFGVGAHPAPGAWAPGSHGPGAHAPWMGQPGTRPDRFDTRPPPAPSRHQPAQSMPEQAPMGVPHVHQYGQNGTQGMRREPPRAGVEAEPASYESQWSPAIIRDFRPPKNEQEEKKQLDLTIERSLRDVRRQPVEALVSHLKTIAKSTPPLDPIAFNDLPSRMRRHYKDEGEYLKALQAESMAPFEKALQQAGMETVHNTIPENDTKSSFLICLEQLKRNDYTSLHLDAARLTRGAMESNPQAVAAINERSPEHKTVLADALPFRLSSDTRLSSRSTGAHLALGLINAGQAEDDRIDVLVIRIINGGPHITMLESGSPSARVVSMWDKGDGHFEPIRPKREGPAYYEYNRYA